MIRIRNLSQDFLNFWDAAQGKGREEQLRLWQELYESKHPEVFGVYFSPPHWGRREGLPEALPRYAKDIETIEKTAEELEKLFPLIVARVLTSFDVGEDEIEFDVIVFVGIYHADGFVFPVAGRTTVFLAVECLAAQHGPGSAELLSTHELSHAMQFSVGLQAHSPLSVAFVEDPLSLFTRLDVRLFAEGFAISASKRIVPGRDESAYLFYSAEQWAWCQQNRKRLIEMTLRGLAGKDQDVYSKLFETREGAEELPYHRTGYYVGWLVIEQLLKRYSLRDLAQMAPGGEYSRLICKALAS
jgi:hypothetical protein